MRAAPEARCLRFWKKRYNPAKWVEFARAPLYLFRQSLPPGACVFADGIQDWGHTPGSFLSFAAYQGVTL